MLLHLFDKNPRIGVRSRNNGLAFERRRVFPARSVPVANELESDGKTVVVHEGKKDGVATTATEPTAAVKDAVADKPPATEPAVAVKDAVTDKTPAPPAAETKGSETTDAKPANNTDAKNQPQSADVAKDTEPEFNAEQTETLRKMKGENKTWKEIAEGMGLQPKDIGRLKAHWKTINKDSGAAGASEAAKDQGAEVKESKKGGGDDTKSKGDEATKIQPNNQPANTTPTKTDTPPSNNKTKIEPARPTPSQPKPNKPQPPLEFWDVYGNAIDDDPLGIDAPLVLTHAHTSTTPVFADADDAARIVQIIERDREGLWARVASAFELETGRWIDPGEVRQALGEMGRA